MRERVTLLAGLALLALAIVLGSIFIAGGIRDRNRTDVITVTGSAKTRIQSDYVVWDASLTSRDAEPRAAVTRLAKWTALVHAFILAHGIQEGELTQQPILTLPPGSLDDNGDTITDYQLTRTFEVRSERVDAVARLAEATSQLLAQGVPLAGESPSYTYTKLKPLRPELLRRAIEDAQGRARVIVEASGAKLGDVRGVDVGVFQITSPNSTDVSDYGAYETSTIPKDVTAVVNVTFALNH